VKKPKRRYFVVHGLSNVYVIQAYSEADAVARVDKHPDRSSQPRLRARPATAADIAMLEDAAGTKVHETLRDRVAAQES
jgi:hypothetical protein